MLNEQDMRAVEGLARSGIDFDSLCKAFPKFPIDEVEKVYMQVRKSGQNAHAPEIKTNCS